MDAAAGITAQAMALGTQRQVSYEVFRVTSIQHQKPEVDGSKPGFKRACPKIQHPATSFIHDGSYNKSMEQTRRIL